MARTLSPRQQRFIAGLQSGLDGTTAAKDAGYSPRWAAQRAHHLINDPGPVRDALERVRNELAQTTQYNGERAMAEAEKAMAFAERTDNANAMVRAIELRARISGVLRDKIDITVEMPDINQALTEAKARVLRPMCDPHDTIEGEFRAIPSDAEGRAIDS